MIRPTDIQKQIVTSALAAAEDKDRLSNAADVAAAWENMQRFEGRLKGALNPRARGELIAVIAHQIQLAETRGAASVKKKK